MFQLINNIKVNHDAYEAIVSFKRSHPRQGDFTARLAKYSEFAQKIGNAYGLRLSVFFHGNEDPTALSDCYYDPNSGTIHLRGKLSIVTLLIGIGIARGKGDESTRWAVSVFRRFFPKSFTKCTVTDDGLVLRTPVAE